MKITALEEYGLRCLLQIARAKEGLSISEIAKAEGLSIQYVSKITAHLKKHRLLGATRGIHGGYQLMRPANVMNLSEVMKALGGEMFAEEFCAEHTGKEKCCVHQPDCSIRSVWSLMYRYLDLIMEEIMLADLLAGEETMREKLVAIISKKAEQIKKGEHYLTKR